MLRLNSLTAFLSDGAKKVVRSGLLVWVNWATFETDLNLY
jgi:hypothetical protein